MTGTETDSFTCRMISQSAGGVYISSRVRPWTHTAAAPSSRAMRASSTAQTLPVTIYSMTKRPYSPKINALSTLLFAVVLALMLIVNLRPDAEKKAKRKGAAR